MRRLLSVAVLSAGLAVAAAPAAAAHTVLVSSDPAGDATLNSGPQRVSATFSEDLQATFAAMTIVGPDGNLWSVGDPEIRGAVAGIAMRPSGPAGRYTVNYRVTSGDGHVVTGSWSFTVSVAGTGTPGPAASDRGTPGRLDERIPLWPFAVGAAALVAVAALWARRGQK